MVDRKQFSQKLLSHPVAKSDAALERIIVAKERILSVLDRELVAHQKTLEQKIAEQGPTPLRVDPHLIGYAAMDMLELNRLKPLVHEPSNTRSWYTNIGSKPELYAEKLDEIGPLYGSISGGGFGNLTGDALEIITQVCLEAVRDADNRHQFQGFFWLDKPKVNGRFQCVKPPKAIGGNVTIKEADFILFGFAAGPICIECKNFREWLYPGDHKIKELIVKSYELGAIPLIIDRRIHYTTMSNFLEPAGIIAHESYFQYYPSDQIDLAERVKYKRSLGFTDVLASEAPHNRTMAFFTKSLPSIVEPMAKRWNANKDALYAYATGEMNLPQMYKAIGSRAGSTWIDVEQE